jgi:hypothetical protein
MLLFNLQKNTSILSNYFIINKKKYFDPGIGSTLFLIN